MSYGPLTVERHAKLKRLGTDLHVFVRGEDVTNRCSYADDTPGKQVARLFRQTPSGRFHLDEDGYPAVEIAEGDDIEIRQLHGGELAAER